MLGPQGPGGGTREPPSGGRGSYIMRFVLLLAIGVVMTACGSLTAPGGTESGFAMNGDVRLRWFLDLPLGNGPFPAVVYGPGSGHITADNGSTIRFARELNDLGFVVMRYDKRGTGGVHCVLIDICNAPTDHLDVPLLWRLA